MCVAGGQEVTHGAPYCPPKVDVLYSIDCRRGLILFAVGAAFLETLPFFTRW